MQHTSVPEPPGFSDLSSLEQIRYVQALWDQIAERGDDLPVPESHLDLAEERLADYHRDPTGAYSAYDIFDRLGHSDR
jgi:putative addiction module component (TIGR02574 family)